MDGKTTVSAVKKRLNAYRELDREIENQIERLDRMFSRLTSAGVQPLSDMPRGSSVNVDKMANYSAEKEELEKQIKNTMDAKAEERSAIEAALSKLKSSNERAVIRIRYIDGGSWDDVESILFGGNEDFLDNMEMYLRRSFRIHGSALKNLAAIGFE